MRLTKKDNKIVASRKRTPTEEFFEEEITAVMDMVETKVDLVLFDKDVEMIENIARERGIKYETAVGDVIKEALDLYRWHINRKL